MTTKQPDLITSAEAASLVGVRPVTIRAWVMRKHLKVAALANVGPNGKMAYLFDPESVRACNRDRMRAAHRRVS